MERGEDVNGTDPRHGRTGLMLAVGHDHQDIVDYLLQLPGLHVNCQETNGWTALHGACYLDNTRVVRLLVSHPGMDSWNTRDRLGGSCPLMLAVRNGSIDCVRELVRVGEVDLETTDDSGRGLEEVAR